MQRSIVEGDITNMSVNSIVLIRKLVSLPHTMVTAITDYRFQHRLKTESETIRHLITLGLRRTEVGPPPDDGGRRPAPPGPYPWENLHAEGHTKNLNVALAARLKAKVDWIVVRQNEESQLPVTLKMLVTSALQEYVDRELARRGIDPG